MKVTWEEFLTTKFGLWVDTRLSTENSVVEKSVVENSDILLQIEKAAKNSDGDLTSHVFKL